MVADASIATPLTPELLRGALEWERTKRGPLPHRLPVPLPDRLHPDAATHRRVGERFAALAFGTGGPFATTRP
jgi:hypothetical protein